MVLLATQMNATVRHSPLSECVSLIGVASNALVIRDSVAHSKAVGLFPPLRGAQEALLEHKTVYEEGAPASLHSRETSPVCSRGVGEDPSQRRRGSLANQQNQQADVRGSYRSLWATPAYLKVRLNISAWAEGTVR
jgi:hypothetical protein